MPFDARNQDFHRFDGFPPLVSIRHGFGDRVEIRRIRRQTNFPKMEMIVQKTLNGLGHVTSACDDDHYYAHKIILAAGGQFLKTKKEMISYSLFVQDLWL